ncbi:MAG: hypothetical protein WBQ94_17755 [Terracidiphilus sp.]
MPEISNVWAVLGLALVLMHQMAGQYLRDRQHKSNTTELEGIRAELVECKARWHAVSDQVSKLEVAFSFFTKSIARVDPGK